MRRLLYLTIAIAGFGIASCSKSASDYDKEICRAEKMMTANTDSALAILDAIDASELEIGRQSGCKIKGRG